MAATELSEGHQAVLAATAIIGALGGFALLALRGKSERMQAREDAGKRRQILALGLTSPLWSIASFILVLLTPWVAPLVIVALAYAFMYGAIAIRVIADRAARGLTKGKQD